MTQKKESKKCAKCDGTKMVLHEVKKVKCDACNGKGKLSPTEKCKLCHWGKVEAHYYRRCRMCLDD